MKFKTSPRTRCPFPITYVLFLYLQIASTDFAGVVFQISFKIPLQGYNFITHFTKLIHRKFNFNTAMIRVFCSKHETRSEGFPSRKHNNLSCETKYTWHILPSVFSHPIIFLVYDLETFLWPSMKWSLISKANLNWEVSVAKFCAKSERDFYEEGSILTARDLFMVDKFFF